MTAANHWQKIGKRTHQGICIPLSALHTKNSLGIGEWFDLLPFIDWCASLHLDVIQLLPVFDTGDDPSPYNPLSSCALDPVYLSLSALPNPHSLAEFEPFKHLPRIDRANVKAKKIDWLRRYFEEHSPNNIEKFRQHNSWLLPYAKYKAGQNTSDIDFHICLQYLCFQQLSYVHAYAASKNVFLKGDIPYLINGHSVDVLESPHLFNPNLQAGAPPDYYNPKGQNWGCPLFNWDVMKADHYNWWKRRMQAVQPYFDIYRLDHVVGLFRIWSIEPGKEPTEGHFEPPDPELWLQHGKELLQMMLEASPLLPMAEDLGTIPPEVRPCLKSLGICGTKVIRWERNWSGDKEFIPFAQYEPLSLTTCSTMDSETLKGWWQKHPEEADSFAHFMGWHYEPELSFERHKQILRACYHTPSLFHINILQDILALFPELVNSNPEEERINIPGSILSTNWTYRFKPSVEEMTSHQELRKTILELLL